MKFNELFRSDHSPSSASLLSTRGKNYVEMMTIMGDRSLVPDYFSVFYFHKKYIESMHGSASGPDVYKRAKERIDSYNDEKMERKLQKWKKVKKVRKS